MTQFTYHPIVPLENVMYLA